MLAAHSVTPIPLYVAKESDITMRTNQWLVFLAVTLPGTALALQGCGATTTGVPGDAGTKDATSPTTDSATNQDATTCPPATVETFEIPGVSTSNADAGLAGCVACLKSKCTSEAKACIDNCECRGALGPLVNCVATNKTQTAVFGCALPVLNGLGDDPKALAQSAGLCVGRSCAAECNPNPSDAGTTDSSTPDAN
jgi:hypothetical protein